MDAEEEQGTAGERHALVQAIVDNKSRVDRPLDSYLENLIEAGTPTSARPASWAKSGSVSNNAKRDSIRPAKRA